MPKRVELQRKTGQRGLIAATRGWEKDSDRAITPSVEAIHVPAHLTLPGSPQAKQLCHLHAQPSLGQSCHRQEKSCIYACNVTLVMSRLCKDCGLPGFSVSGTPQARILECIGQYGCHTHFEHYLSCCPSRQPSEYLVLPEPL